MNRIPIISLVLALSTLAAAAQGTFVYDQQSSIDETPPPFGVGAILQNVSPGAGQSFKPGMNSIGFVKFLFDDTDPNDGLGTTIHVDLHSASMGGPIVGSTAQLLLPNGFRGAATFLFPATAQLTPGQVFFFEVVPDSGGPINIFGGSYNYPAGVAYASGQPQAGSDLWFREGIIVPEPTSVALLLAGAFLFALRRSAK